jgi:serine/threonine-protein kinase HipA
VLFNTLIGNNDAHAKNYVLVSGVGGTTLALLYDALCIAVYK